MPVIIIEIQSVTDDEHIGDRETAVIGLDRDFLPTDLVQEHRGPDAVPCLDLPGGESKR